MRKRETHRRAAYRERVALARAGIALVAASTARLPRSGALPVEPGLDKQKTPEVPASEVFTDRSPEQRIHGGRYSDRTT